MVTRMRVMRSGGVMAVILRDSMVSHSPIMRDSMVSRSPILRDGMVSHSPILRDCVACMGLQRYYLFEIVW